MLAHIRANQLGKVFMSPLDTVLSQYDVLQPDILFVSDERLHIINMQTNVQGAPDLVAEILSPSTAERELIAKRDLYAEHGVKEYWIIDPEARTLTQMTLEGTRYWTAGVLTCEQTLRSQVIEGFELCLVDIYNS